ncbi:MAG: hypothetical protein U0992_00570 [Planctomycetaceae bacterium]
MGTSTVASVSMAGERVCVASSNGQDRLLGLQRFGALTLRMVAVNVTGVWTSASGLDWTRLGDEAITTGGIGINVEDAVGGHAFSQRVPSSADSPLQPAARGR